MSMKVLRLCYRIIGSAALHFLSPRFAAGQVAETATFYLVSGTDTLVVERMTRLPNRLEPDLFDTQRMGRARIPANPTTAGLVIDADASFFASSRDTVPLQYTRV